MEFKKLEQNKRSKIIICFTVLILLLITIVLMVSKAKYQVTKNVQIVNGTINYVPYDFKIVGIFKENDQGKYEETTGIPEGEYVIDEQESKCMIDDNQQDTGAILKTIDGNHTFANLKKMDKCTLYFKTISKALTPEKRLVDLNLSSISSDGCPAESNPTISTVESSRTLLCKGKDDDGVTYYFRGKANKNWVRMGNTYWRIIRINGDGTIRLIYNGTSTSTTGTNVNYGSNAAFNSSNGDNAYVGLKYTKGIRNGLTESSNMYNTLKSFYENNFNSGKPLASYANKLDHNAGFCGDRTVSSGTGVEANITNYAPYVRTYTNHKPILTCPESSTDLYTTSSATKGNHALDYPVGLITADEVMYAGGYSEPNNGYWLYTFEPYRTMSPSSFNNNYATVFIVSLNGQLSADDVLNDRGVRPVINLKADTKFTGSGISGDPFVVQ